MLKNKLLLSSVFFLALTAPAYAQLNPGDQPAVVDQPVIKNHCPMFTTTNQNHLVDSGVACGAGSGTPGGANNTVQTNVDGSFSGVGPGTTSTVLHGNAGGPPAYNPVALGTDVSGKLPAANLADTAVTPGTYGDATHCANLTVDQQGRLTNAAQSTSCPGGGGGGTPGGSNHQVQINSSGSFGGLAAGTAGQVLTSNGASSDPSFTTVAGTGSVTNVATGACLTGGPITTTGTISGTDLINAKTANYTIATTDACQTVTMNAAGATTISIPAASTTGFTAGFGFTIENRGAGLTTLSPTTSLVNGAATLPIPQNTGCSIVSDGTDYQVNSCTALAGKYNLANATGAVVAGGGTGVATLTNHGVILGQGTSPVAVTSAGTSGQVLTSNGASADPTFQAVAGTGTVNSVKDGSTTVSNPSQISFTSGATVTNLGSGVVGVAVSGGGGSAVPGTIQGLNPTWVDATHVGATGGTVYVEGSAANFNCNPSNIAPTHAASTMYHVYINASCTLSVQSAAGNDPVPFATATGTARSKPSDTANRYLYSYLTDGSGNIYQFNYQSGSHIMRWLGPVTAAPFNVLAGGTSTSPVALDASPVAPVTATSVLVEALNLAPGANLYLGPNGITLSASLLSSYVYQLASSEVLLPTDATQKFQYMYSASATTGAYIDVDGWELSR